MFAPRNCHELPRIGTHLLRIKESFSTKSQFRQNVSIQSKVFKEAMIFMGETISDMDIKLKQQDNKKYYLEDEIGIPDSKVIEKMNGLDLNKISNKGKNDRMMSSLNKSFHDLKCNKN